MYLKCDGLKESDQSRCRARSCDGACSWLPQLVRGAEDDICCVEGDHPDDHRLLRFDPCGCLLGLDMFTTQVNMHATSGLGEGRMGARALSTEGWVCGGRRRGGRVGWGGGGKRGGWLWGVGYYLPIMLFQARYIC